MWVLLGAFFWCSKVFFGICFGVLFKEGIHARVNLKDKMLTHDFVNNQVDIFKNGRRDSKDWNEAADFLESYFDENSRVVIER